MQTSHAPKIMIDDVCPGNNRWHRLNVLWFMSISITIFLVGILEVSSFVFSLVRVKLSRGVKNIVTVFSYTVDMIADFRISATKEATLFILHELFKPISTQHFVLLMVTLVLLHISFILEGESTHWPQTVKMGRPLPVEGTSLAPTILGGSEPLEPL